MLDQSIKEDILFWIENGEAVDKFKSKLNDVTMGIEGEAAFEKTYNIAYNNLSKADLESCIETLKNAKKKTSYEERQRYIDYISALQLLFENPPKSQVEEILAFVRKNKRDTGRGKDNDTNTNQRQEQYHHNQFDGYEEQRRRQQEEQNRQREEELRRQQARERRREEQRQREYQEQQAEAEYEEAKRRQQDSRQNLKKQPKIKKPKSRRVRTSLGCLFSILVFFFMWFIPAVLIPKMKTGEPIFNFDNAAAERVHYRYLSEPVFSGNDFDAQFHFIDSACVYSSRRERKWWRVLREDVQDRYIEYLVTEQLGSKFEKSKNGKIPIRDLARYKSKNNLKELHNIDSLLVVAEKIAPEDYRVQRYRVIFDSLVDRYKVKL